MNTYIKRRYLVGLLLIVLLPATFMISKVQGDDYTEIFNQGIRVQGLYPEHVCASAKPGTLEYIHMDLEAVTSAAPDFDRVRMSFQQGKVSLRVDRYKMRWSIDGSLAWHGWIKDEWGSVLLSVYEDSVFGLIECMQGVYKIVPAYGGGYWLYEVDFSNVFRTTENDTIVPPMPLPAYEEEDDAESEAGITPQATTVLRLLICYTKGFKQAYPGSQLNAQINFLIGVFNTTNDNSGLKLEAKLAKKKKVNYTDEGSLNTALDDFTNNRGKFKRVEKWRNRFKADLAILLRVFGPTNSFCGLAWLWPDIARNFARNAYSVTQVGEYAQGLWRYFCADQTMTHEAGHNLGNHHNLGDTGIFKYSVGWIIKVAQWMTVMSYQSNGEATVSYWSNPRKNYQGNKTGSSKANVVKSMKRTIKKAKNWRK